MLENSASSTSKSSSWCNHYYFQCVSAWRGARNGPSGGQAKRSIEAQRIAYKYARKDNEHAQFYNKTLLLVSVAQCVRAVIDDGTNTVLMNCSYEPVIGSCSDTRQSGCCSRDGESGCRRRTITDADVEMS